jgi:hypothetical protein
MGYCPPTNCFHGSLTVRENLECVHPALLALNLIVLVFLLPQSRITLCLAVPSPLHCDIAAALVSCRLYASLKQLGNVPGLVRAHIARYALGNIQDVVAGNLPQSAKRKLTVALAKLSSPAVLILDSPTQGRVACLCRCVRHAVLAVYAVSSVIMVWNGLPACDDD